MKVTTAVVFNNFLFHMNRSQDLMEELRVQASSGKKINKPSDAPADTQRALRLSQSLSQFDQYDRNINRGMGLLDVAESALSGAGDILSKIKEFAVQGSNSSQTGTSRIGLANQVVQLRDQLVALANAEFDGQYVFSGTRTDTLAYTGNGTYGGDSGIIQISIARNTRVNVTKAGNAIFGTAGGGVDVFAAINTLETALRNNDVATIQAQINGVETAREQLLSARTELGAVTTRLEGSRLNMDNLGLTLRRQLAETEDADLAEVITGLQAQKNVLDATIASYGTIASQSLLDFLQ